jgi:hypothetical protein
LTVSVSVPTASDPAGMTIAAPPLLSVVAADV